MIASLAILCLFGLPVIGWIVNNMLKHQREMAQMVHGQKQQSTTTSNNDIEQLRNDVAELKEVILSHSLSMDSNMDTLKRRLESVEEREKRLDARQ